MRRFSIPAFIASALIALASLPAAAQQPRPGQTPPGPGQVPPGPAAQRPQAAQAQGQPQGQAQQQPVAPAKPYKAITVSLPPPSNDASFAAFRKQLGEVAQKKDRAALAKLVVGKDFFWEADSGDKADKKRSSIDNLGAALGGFTGPDAGAWDTLMSAAAEPTLEPYGDKKDVMCSPASPQFDDQALEAVAKDTGTDIDEWAFPTADGTEVHSSAEPNSPVIERLGMNLVRVLPDEASTDMGGNAPPMIRVVTPSGKTGFVAADALASLVSDQLCYIKDAGSWKIIGYIGGT